MEKNVFLNLSPMEVENWESSGYLQRAEFVYIHQEILKIVKKEWELWNRKRPKSEQKPFPSKNSGFSTKLHGYGKFSPNIEGNEDRISVEKVMRKNPNVNDLLDKLKIIAKINFGRHLYEKMYCPFNPKPKNENATLSRIKVSRKLYYHVFFVFLGYRGIEDFRANVKDNSIILPHLPSSKDITKDEIEYNYYIGAYYSKEVCIKTFLLQISKEKIFKGKHEAKEWGYHNVNSFDDDEFQGKADVKGGYLYINLEDSNGRQLNAIGVLKKDDQEFIKVTLQSVSSFSRILSTEAVLIRVEKDQKDTYLGSKNRDLIQSGILGFEDFKTISLYLTIRRNIYSINHEVIKNLNFKLRDIKVADYKYLIGQYRIWNFIFDKRYNVVQSRFTIYPDGTGLLEPHIADLTKKQKEKYGVKYVRLRENLKRQRCKINITNIDTPNPKIWITAFSESDPDLANIALFDYPEALSSEGEVIKGTFTSIGYSPNGIMSGYIVMTKDSREFEICEFSSLEAARYAEEYDLQLFHLALHGLWKEKLWAGTGNKNPEKRNVKKNRTSD